MNRNLLARRGRGEYWENMPRVARFAVGGMTVYLLSEVFGI